MRRILGTAQLLSADSGGRAILAFLERNQAVRYLAWASSRGIAIPVTLERDLAAIRARGYAQGSGEGGVAFPILLRDQSFASVAIEGLGPLEAAPLREWGEIVRAVQAVVSANPALARQPFQHLDPDEVVLPS